MVDYPDIAEWIDKEEFRPRYNISPRSTAPVIRRRDPDDNELVIQTMKWGVVPHWCKHEDLTLNTINARAENLVDSRGMWSSMKGRKRCVIMCDGYYEWLKQGKDRLPHFIRRKDNKLMILAGLYDSVLLEGSSRPLWTFTVVTTVASPVLSWLHDRQPVILSSPADFETWINTSNGWHADLIRILKPKEGGDLECYQVPKEVGRVGSNSPSFIKPITQRRDGIEAMFAKQTTKEPSASQNIQLSSSPGKTSPSQAAHGKSLKRVIDVDVSPPPSPSPNNTSNKRQKLSFTSYSAEKSSGSEVFNANSRDADRASPKIFGKQKPSINLTQSPLYTRGKNGSPKPPLSTSPKPSTDTKITSFFHPIM